ncbi:MarR family transcriptional regulator [Amycolatopsis mediterranei S699]|uniref:MarR family transcriptional regulator n=2 Tax=Amycolatopsis mediterranei TaxID=33910 RepID=A0A0H3D702_AMYMU|nr:MarR family winged helix-turn-helix transcriptional regulator [Amycolatopsis mediterranei]ADJ46112.1 MarR family transcriptional regulator [Amycolatopsis mediterranei U32]AEK42899.1 MarR family transcriptional regulator [Amycolatopsis mediterranei S699]AFO77823.1 MarR family transcriptional regulator [Amycolatopsis mediterranei S699]AGT84951.1 MarR family transcriptional regulator [Amycolatopsis mediterranei RB]KDO05648.1 MarR family transcriptional regulator [Amycolatopsis mediterranei]
MGDLSALDADETAFWRPLMRIMTALPRALEDHFLPETGLAITDYGVLVALSEAPGRLLRISALAATTGLSLSRISRVVDDLTRRGLVEKRRCAEDGRASNAVLTEAGLTRLEAAYPGHLARVRASVFDHLSAEDIRTAGPVLARLAAALEATPPTDDC